MNSIMKQKKTEVVVKPDEQVEAAYNAWTSEENRGNYQANLTEFDMEDKSHKTEEGLEVRLLLSPSGERKFREFASTKGTENMKTLIPPPVFVFVEVEHWATSLLQRFIVGYASTREAPTTSTEAQNMITSREGFIPHGCTSTVMTVLERLGRIPRWVLIY